MKDILDIKENWKKLHNNKYNYSLVEYVNNKTKIKIICPEHGEFNQIPKNHSNGNGCPICAISSKRAKQSKDISILINEFKKINNNKYDYSLVEYINNKTKVKVICPEHGEFKVGPSHHLNGVGCSKCSLNYRKSNDEYIKDCSVIHNNKYDYTFVKFKNNKSDILVICPEHGKFKQNAGHHLYGSGCPSCKQSIGEREIQKILDINNIKYQKEKKFDDCLSNLGYKLKFDFYLVDYNMCIEYDGVQHFRPIEYFGGHESFLKTKENDDIKDEYCIKNNIILKRISYNQKLDFNVNKIINEIMKKN
jgi:hypothetical protein